MKNLRKYVVGFLICIMLIPSVAFAEETSYTSMDLKETLESESIEADLGNYSAGENKVNIYLFRGSGCGYCNAFLKYVATDLVKEYGDYFNLVSYELWYDENNGELAEQVANVFDESIQGVPFFVIGDKTFSGYEESMNDDIETAIKTAFNSEDRYDVMEELQAATKKAAKAETSEKVLPIIWNFCFIAISTTVILLVQNEFNKKTRKEIEELKEMLKKETPKQEKKPTKKIKK